MSIEIMNGFRFNEKYLSQIPALQLLINLGFSTSPREGAPPPVWERPGISCWKGFSATSSSGSTVSTTRGAGFLFSEENIRRPSRSSRTSNTTACSRPTRRSTTSSPWERPWSRRSRAIPKSFNLNYIDWRNRERNVFHVTAEYSVERSRSTETARPDIVMFVNGIPLAVIECKSPKVGIEQAVSQSIRNQSDDYIPKLFASVQLVMGVSKNAARYATVGSSAKFWGIWKELRDREEVVAGFVQKGLTDEQKAELFRGEFAVCRAFFDAQEAEENGSSRSRTKCSTACAARRGCWSWPTNS